LQHKVGGIGEETCIAYLLYFCFSILYIGR